MNTNNLAKQYGNLGPEERFRLIAAASARGDEVERDRLARAARMATIRMPDHMPFALAFQETAVLTLMESLNRLAGFLVAYFRSRSERSTDEDREEDHLSARLLGYLLKVQVEGWKLFCERLNAPPFLVWQSLEGSAMVLKSMPLVDEIAFLPAEVSAVQPAEAGETPQRITVESYARDLEATYRERIRFWSGE